MIYETLNIPKEKRTFVSLPVNIFDFLIAIFSGLESTFSTFNVPSLKDKFEDAAEIARIVKYYATEPMVAIEPKEVQGTTKLINHFQRIAARGGKLEEIDEMTTTTGVLRLVVKNEYAKK